MILAPAMNTMMWDHPFTRHQLNTMLSLGASIVDPIAKTLACGDFGIGAMADVDTIVAAARVVASSMRVIEPKAEVCEKNR